MLLDVIGQKMKKFEKAISLIKKENFKEALPLLKKLNEDFDGDIKKINDWAEVLNISDWFGWMDFEDIPSN